MNIKKFPAKSNTRNKTCDRCRALRSRRGGVSATIEGVSKFVCAACVAHLQGWHSLARHATAARTDRRAA
jgi:hypothetical protein